MSCKIVLTVFYEEIKITSDTFAWKRTFFYKKSHFKKGLSKGELTKMFLARISVGFLVKSQRKALQLKE